MIRFALTAATFVSLAAGLAHAQGAPAAPAPGASVTLAEFQQRRADMIMRADVNHDGKVSKAEWDAAATKMRQAAENRGAATQGQDQGRGGGMSERMFERMDLNHDGFITRDEIDKVTKARFEQLDKNHDGVLTADEMPAARGRPPAN